MLLSPNKLFSLNELTIENGVVWFFARYFTVHAECMLILFFYILQDYCGFKWNIFPCWCWKIKGGQYICVYYKSKLKLPTAKTLNLNNEKVNNWTHTAFLLYSMVQCSFCWWWMRNRKWFQFFYDIFIIQNKKSQKKKEGKSLRKKRQENYGKSFIHVLK